MSGEKLKHDINHHLLFGPLATIQGLTMLVHDSIETKNYDEAKKLSILLHKQIDRLRNGVKQIINKN